MRLYCACKLQIMHAYVLFAWKFIEFCVNIGVFYTGKFTENSPLNVFDYREIIVTTDLIGIFILLITQEEWWHRCFSQFYYKNILFRPLNNIAIDFNDVQSWTIRFSLAYWSDFNLIWLLQYKIIIYRAESRNDPFIN